jgi:CBS domain-containing protein
MHVSELGPRPVETVAATSTIAEAARLMCARSVGALVLTDESGETPIGVITDRDLVWMISEGLDPRTASLDEFVRGRLETVHVSETLPDVTKRMREAKVRRLPVVDAENRLVGIISLDDVLLRLGKEMCDIAEAIDGELSRERKLGAAHAATKRRA